MPTGQRTIGRYQIPARTRETARRGYLLDRALVRARICAATRAAAEALGGLRSLIRDPQQHRRYDRLRALSRVELSAMNVRWGWRNRRPRRAQAIFDDGTASALLGIAPCPRR